MTHVSEIKDKRAGGAWAASTTWAWIVTLCTFGYMLPWAVAASRGHRDSAMIFWFTLLLGWTLLGWVIALVWAFKPHNKTVVVTQVQQASQPATEAQAQTPNPETDGSSNP